MYHHKCEDIGDKSFKYFDQAFYFLKKIRDKRW